MLEKKKKKKKIGPEGKGMWDRQMGQGGWFDQDTLRVWEEKKWMGA